MAKHPTKAFTLSLVFLLAVSFFAIFGVRESQASTSVTYQVSASEDDAYTTSSAVNSGDASLYLSKSTMKSGCRWSINIPRGATIDSAVASFKARDISLIGPKCRISLISQDSCPPFTSVFWSWSVQAGKDWSLPTFLLGGWHDTMDISNMVQNYINRGGYQPGNYLGLIFEYKSGAELGHQVCSLDGDAASAPQLKVTYHTSSPSADFSFSPSTGVANSPVNFDASASSAASGTLVNYAWNFGDGTPIVNDGDQFASHTFTSAGTFNVTLTVTDSNSLTASRSRNIVVNVGPTASFTFNPSYPIVSQSVTFDGSSSTPGTGSITQYSWNFGDGTPIVNGPGSNVNHSYASFGTYNVTLTVTNSYSLTNSKAILINVRASPVASFDWTPTYPLIGETVTFSGSTSTPQGGTITAYQWSFGDGNSQTSTNPTITHPYAAFGNYSVTLNVTDTEGLWTTTSKTVTVRANPTAAFTVSTPDIVGNPVFFDAGSSSDPDGNIVTFGWNFGDGNTSTVTSLTISHTFSTVGNFTVTLTVTDNNGLTNAASRGITVVPSTPSHNSPVADFSYSPTNPLSNDLVNFNAASSYDSDGNITNYSWTFGDGQSGSGITVSHSFLAKGNYVVTLTVTDNDNLTSQLSKTISVAGRNPTASFNYAPSNPVVAQTITFDASSSFDADGTIVNYNWNFGDGGSNSVTSSTTTHAFSAAGNYSVTLTVIDNDRLLRSTEEIITVLPVPVQNPPVANFSFSPTNPSSNDGVTFSASTSYDSDGTITSYNWNFGDGQNGQGISITHSFLVKGNYTVILTVTDNDDLTSQLSKTISVAGRRPTGSFSYAPSNPVASQLVTFDASGSSDADGTIVYFNWNFGDGNSTIGTNPTITHIFNAAGNYNVTLTVIDNDGLSTATMKTITVMPAPIPPVADFSFSPTTPLFNQAVTFNASASYDSDGSILSYSWNFGDGTLASGVVVSHSFSTYGTYWVTLRVIDNDNLTSLMGKYILVIKNPIASFTYTPAYPLFGQQITFNASSSTAEGGSILMFKWDFGDGSSKNETNPSTTHTFAAAGIYTVALTVADSEGLSNSTVTSIIVYATPVVPPTASFTITPNAMANATVIFNATSSFDPDGYIGDYLWDFGDGNQTHTITATMNHTYLLPGNYSVTLTVRDNDGITNSITRQLKVSAYPVAVFTFSPSSFLIGENVTFDASQSIANSQGISLYTWNFGDGNSTTSTNSSIIHTYYSSGTYEVTLNITNSDGLSNTQTKNITVLTKPTAAFTFSPEDAIVDQTILFDAAGSLHPDGQIVNYSWNFGDGNTTVTDNLVINHAYKSQGDFNVTLTVTDNHGYNHFVSKTVHVNPKPVSNDTNSSNQTNTSNNPSNNGTNSGSNTTVTTIHDISVKNITVQEQIQSGQTVDITVTVKNDGTSNETFSVTLFYGTTEITKKTVNNLQPSTARDIVFSWNTSGVPPSENKMKAVVEGITGETDPSDNVMESGTIKISSSTPAEENKTNTFNVGFLGLAPYIAIALCAVAIPSALFFMKRRKKNAKSEFFSFEYIDKILGGNIPKGSTIMVLGKAGVGKSVLCQQLAYQFLNQQKACAFVSYDELPNEIRNRMKNFGWNVSKFEEEKSFSIVDCYSAIAKVASQEDYFVDQPFSLTDLSIMISTALSEMPQKPKVVFLDSATSLFTKLEISRVMRFLQDRSAKTKANGDIFIFTLGKETVAPDFANRLEEAVDGIIELDFVEEKGKRSRRMRVKKLRGQEHRDDWITFEVRTQEGLSFLEQK